MLYSPYLVTATDLTERHYRLADRGLFPDLIRRLILASDHSVRGIQFRAYESVAISGWDGRIDHADGETYIPAGLSRWEIGTNQDAPGKVRSDFEKRNAPPAPPKKRGRPSKTRSEPTISATSDLSASAPSTGTSSDNSSEKTDAIAPASEPADTLDRTQTTLVFVVGREWTDSKEWADAQTLSSEWKAVKVVDATDIHTWLIQHPGIHLWLSGKLGKPVKGTNDLANWWADWAHMSQPIMVPRMVLSGRNDSINELLAWFSGTDETYPVFASSAKEARAFVAAAVMELEEEERLRILTRTIIVSDEQIWLELIEEPAELILIFDFESSDLNMLCSAATRRGKRVILTSHQSKAGEKDSILAPINQSELQKELEDLGMSSDLAAASAALAGESFKQFHQSIMKNPYLDL